MAIEFTRIEFEGGDVIVVEATGNGDDGYIVHGNQTSGWGSFTGSEALSHIELVNELIGNIGKKVERKLSYSNLK